VEVLLVHLPDGGFKTGDCFRSESLGLGYIASVLRRDGHEVEILDAAMARLGFRETLRQITRRKYDILAFTALHDNRDYLIKCVREIRREHGSGVIVVGGYLPTLVPEKLLRACPEIDVLVRGEGEQVASDLMGRIGRGEEWRETAGIAYLRDGGFIATALPSLIQNMDGLPFPARDALRQAPPGAIVRPVVASSRGCFHKCSFCSINTFYGLSGGHGVRYRTPANFVDELEHVTAETGIAEFQVVDDDFIGPGRKGQERAVSIADEIIARGLKIRFAMECRADEVQVDTLKRLKEAGLFRVFLGVESGVQRQLDTMNKGTTVEQNRRGVEAVRELGLIVHVGFIMFDPYTTLREIEENLRFIRETKLTADVPPTSELKLLLYEGLPILEKLRADGLLRENGLDLSYEFRNPVTKLVWLAAKGFDSIRRLRAAAPPAGN